jgi:thioredoxin reductase (NADPH)
MIRTYYKEGKRVDARYAGLEAICYGVLCLRDGNRESYLGLMDQVIQSDDLDLRADQDVWAVEKTGSGFQVRASKDQSWECRVVIVAIGRMGKPKQPDYWKSLSPGLKQGGRLRFEITQSPVLGPRVLVVGGGDTAAEYADHLSQSHDVVLSYRQAQFARMNPVNLSRVESLIASRRLQIRMPSTIQDVKEAGDGRLQVFFESADSEFFDSVVYALGGVSPTDFLKKSAIPLDDAGDVIVDPGSLESPLEGLYVVGDLLGKKQGGGSIIAGFNTAARAVSDLLVKHFGINQAPSVVSLEHLKF